MDASDDALEQRKLKLLAEAAEIESQQQRRRGLFEQVPHYGDIEDAGQQLGRLLSCMAQSRLANEVASGAAGDAACPDCGQVCTVNVHKRTVTGLDGPVEVLEPKAHCPACRRDFFPSA